MAGGRNDDTTDALGELAQVIMQANEALQTNQNNNQNVEIGLFYGLEKFLQNNPPTCKKRYDPKGTQTRLQEIKKSFRVVECIDVHKFLFEAHMLSEEAEYWWENTLQRLETTNVEVTWVEFKTECLEIIFRLMFVVRKRLSSCIQRKET